jgi:hypothetical protein
MKEVFQSMKEVFQSMKFGIKLHSLFNHFQVQGLYNNQFAFLHEKTCKKQLCQKCSREFPSLGKSSLVLLIEEMIRLYVRKLVVSESPCQ